MNYEAEYQGGDLSLRLKVLNSYNLFQYNIASEPI